MIAEKEENIKSQCHQILDYLLDHGSITPLEALELFGCFRLGARIDDLKKLGWDIISEKEKKNGKIYARYVLRGESNA